VGKEQIAIPEENAPFSMSDYADKFRYEPLNYKYWLELDAAGNIVGGTWVSQERPDYVWMKAKMGFTGEFAALNWIYKHH
jgi:hypothetical protein